MCVLGAFSRNLLFPARHSLDYCLKFYRKNKKNSSLVFLGCNHIVNLEDHLNDLGGELKLVLLGKN
jgi:hypothetical protein